MLEEKKLQEDPKVSKKPKHGYVIYFVRPYFISCHLSLINQISWIDFNLKNLPWKRHEIRLYLNYFLVAN